MSGFGKQSGPVALPSSQPRFGTSPPPHQSLPFPYYGPTRSPRGPVAINSVWSPPLAYESSGLAPNAYQSTGAPRRPEALGRVRSPPLSFESIHPVASPYPSAGSHGPSISRPRVGARANALSSTSDSPISQRSFSPVNNTAVEDASTRTTSYPVAKRTRSPPLPAADKVIQGKSYSIQYDTEREIQAKAKRLARFKKELTEPSENKQDIAERNASASRHEQSIQERQKFAGSYLTESGGDFTNGNNPSDFEGLNTSSVIIGLCPDMCPSMAFNLLNLGGILLIE